MGIGIGPVPAVKKLLARPGLALDQMDLVELNGTFACQVLAVPKGWDRQDQGAIAHKLNANGSGISLSPSSAPPACASWPRSCTSLSAARAATAWRPICIGGGQGIAAVFERA